MERDANGIAGATRDPVRLGRNCLERLERFAATSLEQSEDVALMHGRDAGEMVRMRLEAMLDQVRAELAVYDLVTCVAADNPTT